MSAGVEVVQQFRHLRALVIGDAMLDSYLEGTAARLCTEGPVPVVRKTAEERVPGGAANTAANLAALGAGVIFLGVIGRDLTGQLLRAALRDHGIDDSWLVEDERAATLHKLRILANGQYVVRFDEGGDDTFSAATHDRLLVTLDHVFPRCDLVVISDYNYGVVTDRLVDRLCELRADRPCVLAVDAKNLRRFRETRATVITPNHLEAQLAVEPVSAIDRFDLEEIKRAGRRLIEAIDTEHVAVTLAAEGVCLIDRRGRARHFPAQPVPNASDIGAGDSFIAAMALALAAGADCPEATQIGIDAAGIAVGKRRTAIVNHQELLQRVSLRQHVPQRPRSTTALKTLMERIQHAQMAGQTVVFTNGIFDILHAGHIEFLRQAKDLGDLLVVGVNSDRSARLLKGKNRPINSEQNRLALVSALEPVDHALLFDELVPSALIRALRPDIHVKGGDYAGETLPEAVAVKEAGGQVVILPLAGSQSTSGMIDRIVALAAEGGEIGAEL